MNVIACISNKDVLERVWVTDFDPDELTGIIDNHPECTRYRLGEKIRLQSVNNEREIYYKIKKYKPLHKTNK